MYPYQGRGGGGGYKFKSAPEILPTDQNPLYASVFMPSPVLFQIGIRLDFSAEIGCISISSSFAIREHLNDREGHPAYTCVSHFEDTSALYVHIKGPCLKASILKLKTTLTLLLVSGWAIACCMN